jgi:hypothetical protein
VDLKLAWARLKDALKRCRLTLTGSVAHAAVARDLAETRSATAFLRSVPPPRHDARVVLVPVTNNKPFECKLMAMLAVGLRLSGWRVRVLLIRRRDLWARRYMEAFGFDDFVYWEDFNLTAADRSTCAAAAREYLADRLSFSVVKEWHYRDCWIGPNILASLSREAHSGTPDPSDPAVARRLAEILPESLEIIHVAEKIIDATRPDLMYLIEPNYSKNGPLTDVAIKSGVDFIHTVGCPRDDALMIRRLTKGNRRAHPSAIAHENLKRLHQAPWTEREEQELQSTFKARYSGKWVIQSFNQRGTREFDRDEIFAGLRLDPTRKVAVVFSHVLWDANLFYGRDLFEDYGHWFIETVKAACANDRVNWIIKLHPANTWKLQRDGNADLKLAELELIEAEIGPVEKLPDHVHLLRPDCDISSWSLFQITDYGVTVRGTVSTELPCLGIPVFTAGTGRAYGHGFTIDSASREEYLEHMARIHEMPPLGAAETALAKRHAHAIFELRPWIMRSFQPVYGDYSNRTNPLAQNLVPAAGSIAEIESKGDLRAWAEYAALPDQIDYLQTHSPA